MALYDAKVQTDNGVFTLVNTKTILPSDYTFLVLLIVFESGQSHHRCHDLNIGCYFVSIGIKQHGCVSKHRIMVKRDGEVSTVTGNRQGITDHCC